VSARIVWSPLALRRAEEAADFIARDDPAAAARWARGLFDAVKSLSAHPRRGRVVPEQSREEVRELLYGDYRLIYRVSSRRAEVLTVRHGRRRFDPGEAGGEE
jgi:plasmid stabilization system protein ParE